MGGFIGLFLTCPWLSLSFTSQNLENTRLLSYQTYYNVAWYTNTTSNTLCTSEICIQHKNNPLCSCDKSTSFASTQRIYIPQTKHIWKLLYILNSASDVRLYSVCKRRTSPVSPSPCNECPFALTGKMSVIPGMSRWADTPSKGGSGDSPVLLKSVQYMSPHGASAGSTA